MFLGAIKILSIDITRGGFFFQYKTKKKKIKQLLGEMHLFCGML